MTTGAPAASPPANDVVPAASSAAPAQVIPDVAAPASSPEKSEGVAESFDDKVARLEGRAVQVEAPPAPESPDSPEAAATNDEPAVEPDEPTTAPEVSKDKDEAKTFAERPEWKEALALVPAEHQPKMRAALRSILGKEQAAIKAVEARYQPAAEIATRIEKAVGSAEAVKNAVAFMELYQAADPRADAMLQELVADYRSRTGAVLTSPDLVRRNADLEKRFADGAMTSEDRDQARKDLFELEKARIEKKRVNSQTEAQRQAAARQAMDSATQALASTCDAWETEKGKSDPDYKPLKQRVEDRAYKIGTDVQARQNNRILTPAQMRQVLDQALAEVKAEAAKERPPARARNPITSNGSSATTRRAPSTPQERYQAKIEALERSL